MVYAFDSARVDLCLSLFPWAQFPQHKSAVIAVMSTTEFPPDLPITDFRRPPRRPQHALLSLRTALR